MGNQTSQPVQRPLFADLEPGGPDPLKQVVDDASSQHLFFDAHEEGEVPTENDFW